MAYNAGVTTTQSYLTVEREWGPEEILDKGSRFVAFLNSAPDREAAEAYIAGLRARYPDATHVCYAWRLGKGDESEHRYNDDGEPGGTAGLPIYNEIRRRDYLGVVVAVVRYFGGVKLGTGGLARAYGRAARRVLDASEPKKIVLTDPATISFPFESTGEVMQVVRRMELEIIGQEHTPEGTRLTVKVPRGQMDALRVTLLEAGAGKVTLIPGKPGS